MMVFLEVDVGLEDFLEFWGVSFDFRLVIDFFGVGGVFGFDFIVFIFNCYGNYFII